MVGPWLVHSTILAVLMLLSPGVTAIEFSLSMEDGGSYTNLESYYDVDTEVSVDEVAEADPANASIHDMRTVSGSGKINVGQCYSGSGGYQGNTYFQTTGSGSLASSASLTPSSLSASQNTASGPSSYLGLSLTKGGAVSVAITKHPGTDIYTANFDMKWPAQLSTVKIE